MARINRTAFTLVEMLVVIVIISMLVALLVPAVIGARERARRALCMNRMDQCGKAILQYEADRGQFPGYVNQFGGGTLGASSVASNNNLSWVVMILENIGRADLWKEWRRKNRQAVVLTETICPSDINKRGQSGGLSFAVNCGISDDGNAATGDAAAYEAVVAASGVAAAKTYEQSAWGLFFDHDTTNPNGLPGSATRVATIGLDGIPDGAQQTIMLSENLDADRWDSPAISGPTDPIRQPSVGIVWWSGEGSLPWIGDIPNQVAVNAPTTDAWYKARPSSNHPGGVNALMADGHAEFISDRVDYTVFRDQMISDRSKVKALGLLVP